MLRMPLVLCMLPRALAALLSVTSHQQLLPCCILCLLLLPMFVWNVADPH